MKKNKMPISRHRDKQIVVQPHSGIIVKDGISYWYIQYSGWISKQLCGMKKVTAPQP